MDISKLEVGQVYKNYKELCLSLDDKPKTGNAKKYQMIDWERYFSWDKEGHKFIIKGIHDQALDKTVKRGGNNILPFIDEMELLLLDMIIKNSDSTYITTKSKMMLDMYMINSNYHKYFVDRDTLSNLIGLDVRYIIDFYDTTSNTFRSAIDTVTKRLESKKLVIHERVYMINVISESKILEQKDKNVNTVNSNNVIYRRATEEEKKNIISIERHVLEDIYNCNTMQDLYKINKVEEYYNTVARKLKDEMNIIGAHKAESYTYDMDNIIKQKIRLLKDYEVKGYGININTKVMERIHDNSEKRYQKALDELATYHRVKKEIRANDDYTDNIDYVSSNIIDINNEDSINKDGNRIFDDMD